MKIPNPIENLIIAAITVTATVLIMNFASIKPLENQIEQQNSLIKELAMLEKYQIENNFDKLKSHKGQIVLDLNNDMTVTQSKKDSIIINNFSSIEGKNNKKPGSEKSFWQKLKFWKK